VRTIPIAGTLQKKIIETAFYKPGVALFLCMIFSISSLYGLSINHVTIVSIKLKVYANVLS